MKFVNPQNDIAFRRIFGNENCKDVLIGFLNAVLELSDDHAVVEVTLLSPFEAPKIEDLKLTILDVKATDAQGRTFIVEMQVSGYAALKKRFQYYVARSYSNQIERGEDYPKLNQVIFIGLLNFNEFEGDNWFTRHLVLNQETGKQELKDLEFNFIELPKFTQKESDLVTLLEKWVWFIKHAPDLEVIPAHAQSDPALRHAWEIANRFSWSKGDLELYESVAMRRVGEEGFVAQEVAKGRAEGEAKGRAEGEAKGRAEGEAKGRAEGEYQAKLTIARALLPSMDDAQIAHVTGLLMQDISILRGS